MVQLAQPLKVARVASLEVAGPVVAQDLFAVPVAFRRAMYPAAVLVVVGVCLKNKLVKIQVVPDPGRNEMVVDPRKLKVNGLAFGVLAFAGGTNRFTQFRAPVAGARGKGHAEVLPDGLQYCLTQMYQSGDVVRLRLVGDAQPKGGGAFC